MANWRERGYVPDSDDEGEEGNNIASLDANHDNTTTSDTRPIHASSLAKRAAVKEYDTLPDVGESATKTSNDSSHIHAHDNHFVQAETNELKDHDYIENGHQESSPESDSIPASAVARLEAEIQKGLRAVQDVLTSLPSALDSDIDSPLSSPPSVQITPRQSPSRNLGPSVVETAATQTLVDHDLPLSAFTGASRRRSFRPRAPIQLHPYALEDARYRQAWTDRGLRPVRAPEIAPNPQQTSNEESQGTTAFESSQVDVSDDLVRHPSPALDVGNYSSQSAANDESQGPVRGTGFHTSSSTSDSDDGLPDLSEIFKGRAVPATTVKLKKPKRSSWLQPRTGKDGFQIYDLPDDGPVVQRSSRAGRAGSTIPPSPPQSRGGLSSQDGVPADIADALMGDSTPALLPTPLVSSDKHASKRTFAGLVDNSDSENGTVSISNDSATSSASSSEEGSHDESQRVQRMRRRIKGVLPASWLKLDMKQQQKPVRHPRNQEQSPVKSALEKGIAKHVPSSGRRAGDGAASQILAHDVADTDASSESELDLSAIDEMDDIVYDVPDVFEDDVFEDNAFDAMLAPALRNRPVRKRQQRLSGAWSKKKSEKIGRTLVGDGLLSSRRNGKIPVTAQSHREARPRKKVKRKHKKPQMTILDAPGFKEKNIPRFLRIASRRSVNISTARKQDPSKKFFRLSTMRDTQDANEGLRRWRGRQGQVHHAVDPDHEVSSRTTPSMLQPRGFDTTMSDGNSATLAHNGHISHSRLQDVNNSDTQLKSLKKATKATLDRIRHHQGRAPLLPGDSTTSFVNHPSAILDYFKPRTSRRRRLNPPQPNRIERDTEEPEEPVVALLKPFTIDKRVPRPARRERRPKGVSRKASAGVPVQPKPPMSSSAGKRELSPPSPFRPLFRPPELPPSRPPKKQRPISLTTRDDNAFNQHDLLCLQGLRIEDQNDIISHAIKYPPGPDSLLNTQIPLGFEPVRLRLLRVTLSSMADTAGLFQHGWDLNGITTPKSQQTLSASSWSTEVEAIIRESFTEIFEVMCTDVAASTLSSREQTRLLSRAADSIEAIVTYINESVSFSDERELETFVQLALESMENLLQGMAICGSGTTDRHASHTLKILNGFIILGYQIDQCITAITSLGRARSSTFKTRMNIAGLAWDLAFRKEHIGQLFAYIAAQPGTETASDGRRFHYAAEVETVLFIHRLGPHHEWNVHMDNILSNHGKAGDVWQLQSQAESLACTVLVLGCILAVAGSGVLSTRCDTQSSASLGCAARDMLPIRVSEFLKFFVEEKARYNNGVESQTRQVRKLEQFGVVMFRWCFLLARNFLNDVADKLLKQMFKYYSEEGMLELFARGPINKMPRFLEDQESHRDLLPEDADTDFHLFLKLAAITLKAEPPADRENAQLLRKLDLRKRSLLFLFLPNKGHDLRIDSQVLVNEDQDLPLTDFAAISNRYILFATLYHYAPIGFKPELSQIRDYVEFTTAHDGVRKVILRCWATIAKSVLSQPRYYVELLELGQWILKMFFSMCDKLREIPADDNSTHQDESVRTDYHVHRINRKLTTSRLYHIATRYAAAIDLCADEDQTSSLLIREEVSSLILRCYSDQGLGDAVVSRVFDLLTSYIKKGLKNANEALFRFRRDIRGVLVDQLSRNDVSSAFLLVSMTDTWYALGKVMVDGGHAHWGQFLNAWSPMSFPQIADTDYGRQCQVLLMSKIAADRGVVLADPYPFIHLLLWSTLRPDYEIGFVHRLLNQLMESIPDVFALDALRQKLSNGVERFFLDWFDVINHRFTIVDHFIRQAYGIQAGPDAILFGKLTRDQWDNLMRMIPNTLKQTLEQLFGEARPEWTTFTQKVLFRLSLYNGPGFRTDSLLIDINEGEFESKTFKLGRLFIRLSGQNRPNHSGDGHTAKVFRMACETACIKNEQKLLVPHLVAIFAAADLNYVDDDGTYLLDIPEQLEFMKAVFPAYIESALDVYRPTMLFAIPVLDAVAEILRSLELRVDLEDQARMESFAELTAVLMRAAVTAMQRSPPSPLNEVGWQIHTICRLVNICALGCGRWAHLHQLFPSSAAILALQATVQTYACYAYEYACSVAADSFGRWADDFGFEVRGLALPEHINALKHSAAKDLKEVGEDWVPVTAAGYGPGDLERAVLGLERSLTLVGVMEEEL